MGAVSNIVRDTWTGEIRKFGVATEPEDTVIFYSPEDVAEIKDTGIKLNIVFDEAGVTVEFGSKVFDKNGMFIGTVNYLISDSLTGAIKSFEVETDSVENSAFFSLEDVEKVTPKEVRLKRSYLKPEQ